MRLTGHVSSRYRYHEVWPRWEELVGECSMGITSQHSKIYFRKKKHGGKSQKSLKKEKWHTEFRGGWRKLGRGIGRCQHGPNAKWLNWPEDATSWNGPKVYAIPKWFLTSAMSTIFSTHKTSMVVVFGYVGWILDAFKYCSQDALE